MDVVDGALLVAREEYPRLDAAAYRLRLGGMAAAVRERARGPVPAALLAALDEVFFREEGFGADRQTYYDPRNSYLNEVVDRRRGIPITLSIAYIEVGRHAGLPLYGVNFPGHFLVLCRAPEGDVFIDVFEGGVRVTPGDCEARLRQAHGRGARLAPLLLEPTGPRQILYRLLNNLKSIFMKTHEPGRALACVERMLMLVPDSAAERRDRGLLLSELQFPELARRDLEKYLLHDPGPGDAATVFETLKALHQRLRLAS